MVVVDLTFVMMMVCCCVVGDDMGLVVSVYSELNCSRDVIVVDLVVGKGRDCRWIKRRW